MSEKRQRIETWRKFLPGNQGKKVAEIELFPARLWAGKWEPGSRSFYPLPSFQSMKRREYWLTRYRLKVGGCWYGSRATYCMYTLQETIQIFLKLGREQ